MKKQTKIKTYIDNDVNNSLLFQLKTNKRELFHQVVEKFGNKVYSIAYHITKNHSEAEEVFQDVFLTVYEKLDSLKSYKALSSWIYKITLNYSNLRIRDNIKNKTLINRIECTTDPINDEEQVVKEISVEDNILNAESKRVIECAIKSLPIKYKEVVILKDLENLSIKETGKMLNLSVSAVKSNLHRARRQLKTMLDKYFLERTD